MNESLEQRVAHLEKMLLIANQEIQRLKERQEDFDLVTEKTEQLENTILIEIDKHRILANKVQTIDEEHARMFLISERIAEKASVFALQYSSMEESMGHVLKSMRRHDKNIRTVNDTASKLRQYVVQRIDEHECKTEKTTYAFEKQLEEKWGSLDTQIRFKMRVLEHELETKTTNDIEMVEKINKIVTELENFQKPQPKSKNVEKMEPRPKSFGITKI